LKIVRAYILVRLTKEIFPLVKQRLDIIRDGVVVFKLVEAASQLRLEIFVIMDRDQFHSKFLQAPTIRSTIFKYLRPAN
jgi:hypothetical protein